MSRFAPLLESTERELDLPPRERTRIMAELASDAAGLFEYLRRSGASEADAAREVEKWVRAAPTSLRELEQIHRPLHRRWAVRLARGSGHSFERGLSALVFLGLIAAATRLASQTLLSAPLWSGHAVFILGFTMLAVAFERVHALWIRGARDGRRRGFGFVAFCAAAAPAVALLGGALALVRVAAGADVAVVWTAIGTAAGLLAAGLIFALLGAAARLGLEQRARLLEQLDSTWKEAR